MLTVSIFDVDPYIEVMTDTFKLNPEYVLLGLAILIMLYLSGSILLLFLKGLSR